MTRKEADHIIEEYQRFQQFVSGRLEEMAKADPVYYTQCDGDDIVKIYHGQISMRYKETWSYGGETTHVMEVHLDDLFPQKKDSK